MKKLIALFAALLLAGTAFAQTKVDAKKLAKALESNKDSSAVFVSELDLSKIEVADDGKISLPLFAKSKASLVAGMDMTNINERVAFANKKSFTVTFEAKDIASKTYAITNIDGIENAVECAARLQREAKEKWERERRVNLLRLPVQIVSLDAAGLLATEAAWLSDSVKGRLRFDLQEYLGMKAVVDFKSESALKNVLAQTDASAPDKAAAEYAKATNAKFALFEKLKKTAKGYSISADFVDLTTGEKLASVTSKEYVYPEDLFEYAGAADEITLLLADKLELRVSDANKDLLSNGPANFNKGKRGVLKAVNVIENKKSALVALRKNVEARCQELFEQLLRDRANEEKLIREKEWGVVELGNDGQPTDEAKERRERRVAKANQELTNKFFADCDAVKAGSRTLDNALLAEIRADQKALSVLRTASSKTGDLKVEYGSYDGDKNGWNAKIALYENGFENFKFDYILPYEALSGKKAPDMKSELNDVVVEEYQRNVEKFSGLLGGNEPICHLEIDYALSAAGDENPSSYNINYGKVRVINAASGKIAYSGALSKTMSAKSDPAYDLRIFAGAEEKEKARFDRKKYPVEKYMARGLCKSDAEKKYGEDQEIAGYVSKFMVKIPGKNIKMMSTEVTQRLYQRVMGENPSGNKGANNPVENVSWYEAIYFCNELSEKSGYEPVYSVNGETDVSKWGYTSHKYKEIKGGVTWNEKANGFRLSTEKEWEFAANGGQNFTYSGSNNLDAVGWYERNSGDETHPVAQKRPNGYGLYDMSGNVWEWVWDANGNSGRYYCGGSYYEPARGCEVSDRYSDYADHLDNHLGFRVARSLAEGER
ncbi:MAG: formylglycine-generating enzyme family protein [Treponema sp.]|nr:formylglycine-generating enzyme family protein [Treponema sp.]MEE3434026.1 formylglycine-generating enzyme family protein [Treponema sp.]